MTDKRISAVMLSFNSARYLERCLGTLVDELRSDPDAEDEIFVIDNGSNDGSVEILQRMESELGGLLNVTYLPENTGTTYPRNMALRQVSGRYVLIIDSDVDVPAGTIGALIERLESDDRIGLVAPKLLYPSGKLQMSVDVFPTVMRKLQRYLSLKKMEAAANEAGAPTEPSEVDYAISAFWLLPRAAVDAVGLFDERIFYSPEDVDYCIRVWAAGYRIVYDPTVHAIHDAQEISRGLRKVTFSHAGGLLYLFKKHRYFLGHRALYRRLGRVA